MVAINVGARVSRSRRDRRLHLCCQLSDRLRLRTSTLWQRLISTPAEPARFDRALRIGPDLLSP
jgi:hypothetical protein